MEKVFWLMWLADLSASVGVVGLCALVAALITTGAAAILEVFDEKDGAKRFFRVIRWLAAPVVLSMLFPSSNTIRLIALSSAGEAATETQIGKKGAEALNAVLDKIISETKPKK